MGAVSARLQQHAVHADSSIVECGERRHVIIVPSVHERGRGSLLAVYIHPPARVTAQRRVAADITAV